PNAGRADGHVVELAEYFHQRAAQFLLYQLAGLLHGEGRHVALQLFKLVDKRLGQQVGAVAEGLGQLDKPPALSLPPTFPYDAPPTPAGRAARPRYRKGLGLGRSAGAAGLCAARAGAVGGGPGYSPRTIGRAKDCQCLAEVFD
nr:hypothetical protein [Tanacetum cinerariifolium]